MSQRSRFELLNVAVVEEFTVLDTTGAVVTGLANGSFTKALCLNGASNAQTVTIAEIGTTGHYTATFTPNALGRWYLYVAYTGYGAWEGTFVVQEYGSTVNDAAASTTSFVTSLTEATNDYWKDYVLRITSGALAGQARRVTAYTGATKAVTVEAFTAAPANSVSFELIPVGSSVALGGITSTSFAAGAINAAAIAADAIGASELAADAATEIANALLDLAAAVDGYTVREVLKLLGAVIAGKYSGEPSNPVTFRALNDGADRVASTIDANGNRTGVTLTP